MILWRHSTCWEEGKRGKEQDCNREWRTLTRITCPKLVRYFKLVVFITRQSPEHLDGSWQHLHSPESWALSWSCWNSWAQWHCDMGSRWKTWSQYPVLASEEIPTMVIAGHTLSCCSGRLPTRLYHSIPRGADSRPRYSLHHGGCGRAFMAKGLHGGEIGTCPIPGTSWRQDML